MGEMRERLANAIFAHDGDFDADVLVDAVLAALREPTPEMIAATLPFVDAPTYEQQTLAKAAIALLPPVRIEQRFKGEIAAAELVRDWQAMIAAASDAAA